MDQGALLKIKKGYLNEDFRFFHLKDKKSVNHTFHYHDFNKIVIFLSGNVTYVVEGKYYKLRPWDILLVGSNELHKPMIDPNESYERIVIWINSDFLTSQGTEDTKLASCFEMARKEKINLFRFAPEHLNVIKDTLFALEKAKLNKEFGDKLLQRALFFQLMIYLNRLILRTKMKNDENDIQYDERIENMLSYINENLEEELTIDHVADKFFINRYYLMHHFKEQTGYTLHHYILQKRLAKAAAFIKKGLQIASVADQCGFNDYSSFVRAFKKSFGLSPKQYYKTMEQMEHFGVDIDKYLDKNE